MIIAGTSPALYISFEKDEPGMVLQRNERKPGWGDFLRNSELLRSPVIIDELPAGK